MNSPLFYSTNNKSERVSFTIAFMNGLASNYGLYMLSRDDIPKLEMRTILSMRNKKYSEIAFIVLHPFLREEISDDNLKSILDTAYDDNIIPTYIQNIVGKTYFMWLSNGPTYSFKDYAARFFANMLDFLLKQSGLTKSVVVATSGDTGGAVASALNGLTRIHNILLFPRGYITERQRRQMTTLKKNVYAFEVNGDFDVCQALAKRLLGDKSFAKKTFNDPNFFTSANSISIGRLLPQAVYPFFAFSRIGEDNTPIIISVPSGNFGNMMGTVIAKEMGLPISKILCGVNENKEFPEFLKSGKYIVKATIQSPSYAMNVSNPSNFARLVDFYNGHIYDKRDDSGRIMDEGIMDTIPDLDAMRRDLYSISVSNDEHYSTMREVYRQFRIVIEPHGAVGWRTLQTYINNNHDQPAVVYETADPGKFPDDVIKAIGIIPDTPQRIASQSKMKERIYHIDVLPEIAKTGSLAASDKQYEQFKSNLCSIFKNI